jgi:hypothetical protein
MTWDQLAEFITTLTPEQRTQRVMVQPDPLNVPQDRRWSPPYAVTCALPWTKHMGGPYLFAQT